MKDVTIGFSGGHTAGHVMPIVALAEAWRTHYPGDHLICYGSPDGLEAELLRGFDLSFQSLPALPEQGGGILRRLAAYRAAAGGFLAGRRDMRRRRLDALICFGGFACVGAGLAAASLGCPLVVFEANARPGRANRLLAPFASLKLVAMSEIRSFASWKNALSMELPLRAPEAWVDSKTRDSRPTRLLITGGTFGSDVLNREAPGLIALLAGRGRRLEVHHQAGTDKKETVEKAYRVAGPSDGIAKVTVSGFDPELYRRWGWADAALCSAGAGTLAEMAASGTGGLVVPQAAVADGHQEANARALAARQGLTWLAERDWRSDTVADHLEEVFDAPRRTCTAPVRDLTETVSTLRAHCLKQDRQERRET
ncbi:glycosyltransferase [Fodinicurvata halophila]|uniref:Glycosyltransferase n=1 Tax=Fodinicurvata halophila TaxID=1419723 RepID=A0ABV8UHA3_9PROT